MKSKRSSRLLLSCWLTLIALGLFVWSVLDPDPIPVMLAMSVGQVLGTIATLSFLSVLVTDLIAARVLGDEGERKE